MIGNEYLKKIFEYCDENHALNHLLDLIKKSDDKFIQSIKDNPPDLDFCNQGELNFLIKVASIIDYKFQLKGIEVPDWLRDARLEYDKPYFHSRRICNIDKIKLIGKSPAPFRNRNVYFELESLERI